MDLSVSVVIDPAPAPGPARRTVLLDAARELEASFLSEMLAHAGLGAGDGEFSGGPGAAQFASYLRDAQARAMVEHGGIGLAEQIFNSLVRRDNATG
jgi:flagellar protein FlgJ